MSENKNCLEGEEYFDFKNDFSDNLGFENIRKRSRKSPPSCGEIYIFLFKEFVFL
jgi:hypothetical protein